MRLLLSGGTTSGSVMRKGRGRYTEVRWIEWFRWTFIILIIGYSLHLTLISGAPLILHCRVLLRLDACLTACRSLVHGMTVER